MSAIVSAAISRLGRPVRSCWIAGMLVIAVVQVFIMAAGSPPGAHPDESLHLRSAEFYRNHILPPAASDPSMPHYLDPRYGVTYLLTSPQISYALAGWTASLLGGTGLDFALGVRLFQAVLFAMLAIVAALIAIRRGNTWPAFALILTPQLWYVFGCFNGDAFPLFCSLLLAVPLGLPASELRRFADGTDAAAWRAAAGAGVLLGLLLLSKRNYAVLPLFAAGAALLHAAGRPPEFRGRTALRWVAVFAVAAAVSGPLLVRDRLVDGGRKEAVKRELVERHAADAYKPSRRGTAEAEPGLGLRARGVSLPGFLTEWPWRRRITRSFAGVYGPMTVLAPQAYYVLQGLLYLGFAAWILARVRRARPGTLALALWAAAVGVLVVAGAVMYAWTYDFQAQGRYLFPIIPVALTAALAADPRAEAGPPLALVVPWFVLNCYSFTFVGLRALLP